MPICHRKKMGEFNPLRCCREDGHAGICNWVVEYCPSPKRKAKPKPVTDANEVLCRILELETLSIGSEPVLRYSEVIASFAALPQGERHEEENPAQRH